MKAKQWMVVLCVLGVVMGYGTVANAEWHFGLGTGPQYMNVSGDVGFDTALGAVDIDVDLDPDDIADFTKSAIGLGGYATNGKWMIEGKIGRLEMEEEASRGTRTGATLAAEVGFDITGAEFTVGYPVYQESALTIRVYTGARYTKHKLDLTLTGTGYIGINRSKNIDESWTDVLIGLSLDVPFAEKWNWNIKGDAGFGGSERTYLASTSITWRFYGGWSATLFGIFVAVDLENGTKGNADWYLYDVDESSLGLTILYNW